MVNNDWFDFTGVGFNKLASALGVVLAGILGGFFAIIYLSNKVLDSSLFGSEIMLNTTQELNQGYIGVEASLKELVGCSGVAHTVLRPSGKVLINDEQYDAVAETGFIDKA